MMRDCSRTFIHFVVHLLFIQDLWTSGCEDVNYLPTTVNWISPFPREQQTKEKKNDLCMVFFCTVQTNASQSSGFQAQSVCTAHHFSLLTELFAGADAAIG